MTPIEAGTVLTILGALVAFYINVNKRLDDRTDKMTTRQNELEDCVEDKVGELTATFTKFQEGHQLFQVKVVERLTAIETHLRGSINGKR